MRDNESHPLFIGRITGFGEETDPMGSPTRARVAPITSPDSPTPFYDVLYTCRWPWVDLDIGDEVWCGRAEDGRGIVLCKTEPEFAYRIPGNIDVKQGAVHVEGQVIADEDVTGLGTPLHTHTHGGSAPPDQ